jgi:hypothetical protein
MVCGGRGRTRAVHGRSIYSTKVKALPERLGQCTLLESLCVPCAFVAVRALPRVRCRAGRWAAPRGVVCGGGGGVAGRRPRRAWARMFSPRPTGARWGGAGAARCGRMVAHRDASNTELAALPAAADWPNLKSL